MQKSLQKADNYSLISSDNQEKVILSIDKICYVLEVDGALTPIACGDEITLLGCEKIAIRQGQRVKII